MKNYKVAVELGKQMCLSSKDNQGKNLIFLCSENTDRCGVQVDKTSLSVVCMGTHKYRGLRTTAGYFLQLFMYFGRQSIPLPEAH